MPEASSKTKRDIQCKKIEIGVASRVSKRLELRILENQEILEKFQIRVMAQPKAESPLWKLNFGSSS